MAQRRRLACAITAIRCLCLGGVLWLAPLFAAGASAQDVTIFAAASTTSAVLEIAEAFEAASGIRVRPVFAASSTLAKQIDAGAPADIFLSANNAWMDYLQSRDRLAPGTRVDLLSNRLVLIAPADSDWSLTVAPGFPLAAALGDRRLVIGDPSHVPAGIYAKAALVTLGVWGDIAPKAAFAGDVRAALVLVERGEAAAGLVYASDAAIDARVRVVAPIPPGSHPPITFPLAVAVGRASPEVTRFYRYLAGAEARARFEAHGFIALAAEG